MIQSNFYCGTKCSWRFLMILCSFLHFVSGIHGQALAKLHRILFQYEDTETGNSPAKELIKKRNGIYPFRFFLGSLRAKFQVRKGLFSGPHRAFFRSAQGFL
jgi:hypothetical protein